jgi:hypothetical protein
VDVLEIWISDLASSQLRGLLVKVLDIDSNAHVCFPNADNEPIMIYMT